MPTYILQELPANIGKSFSAFLANYASLSTIEQKHNAAILQKFSSEILNKDYQNTTMQTNKGQEDSFVVNLTLKNPWLNKYSHIRIFILPPANYGTLLLQQLTGEIETYALSADKVAQLDLPLASRKRLGKGSLFLYELNKWDNLTTYTPELSDFYRQLNCDMASVLVTQIQADTAAKPLIIDLGCGTGDSYRFLKEQAARYALTAWNYIGVDFNALNITKAKKTYLKDNNAYWEYSHAHNFLINPFSIDKYLDRDIYVMACGLMEENVISFAQSIKIMRELVKNKDLKGFFISGLHASHISPYLAKQMGLRRLMIDVPQSHHNIVVEGFCPSDKASYIARFKRKADAYAILDLSYVTRLHEILLEFTKKEIESITHVYLFGVIPTQNEMKLLERFIDWNPHLKVLCAVISKDEESELKTLLLDSPNSAHFTLYDEIESAPAYSPFFYGRLHAAMASPSHK